ncbi:MAG: hypothetical protein A2Z16_07665 [Chloroflexi bacterium RBG_16_54_18]|nr:MAG: hypothetical protein A2Z16_07665 [Chloroflexi bacterium RBG_16_54_18]
MYSAVLSIHNIIRWIALILGILAAVRAYLGWFGNREWNVKDRKIGSYFTIAMDVQLLLGLLLYIFLSPATRTAFQDFGAAMQVGDLRFYVLVHPFYMVLAVIFAHLGSILSRKTKQTNVKFRRAAIWFSLSVLAVILGMPWTSRLFPGF